MKSAVVNYQSAANPGNNQNVNQLTQTMTTTNSDVDPADNKVHIRFAVAPVLFSGGHDYPDQPYYYVELDNLTKGTQLFQDFNASAQPGVPWKTDGLNASIYYTDWSLVDIAPGNSALAVGDQVKLVVVAGGCSFGGHFGRVYVDGIGSAIPGTYTSATGPASANMGSDVTYVISYKNGGTATAAATQLSIVIPLAAAPQAPVTATSVWPIGTTYRSNSLPSACSGVAVGGTGTLTCALGDLAAGASGSFTVTMRINTTRFDGASATAGLATVTNGNYSIRATGVTPLVGPKVVTSVTSGVTYADVAVTKTDGVAAVGWGQAVTYTVAASNAGPGALASVTVADTMPAQLAGVTWTCAGTSGGTCTAASGTGNLGGTIGLPVGATATYTISGTIVAGTGTGSIVNTATATLNGGAVDPDTTNNTAVDTDSIGVLRTLAITKTNANGGTVTSVPASIACGTACASATGSFVDGTTVVLSASPVSGAAFTAWGGACTGSATTCTLTITSNLTVTAAFTPPPTVNLITGDNQGALINTAFATTLTVRVLDSGGNPLAGRTVLFTVPPGGASSVLSASSVTTDATGLTPAITATANGTAGAYTIVAALSGSPTTGNFSVWNYGAATTLSVVSGSPQSATVATAFGAPLVVMARDTANQPVPGVTITFTAPGSGPSATPSAASATTAASGLASVTAIAGQIAGSYSITAASGLLTPVTFALTSTAGAAASVTATSGGGQAAFNGTAFASPLVVTVRDSFGNPVTGAAVTFAAPGAGASAALSATSGTTGATGQLGVTATANGTLGVYSVTATIGGVPVSFSLRNYGTLALAPTSITVAPRASVTFTASGDPTGAYVFAMSSSGSAGSIDAGTGIYTAGPTGGATDVVRVTDSLARSTTATVTVGPGVSITPGSASIAPRGTRTFSAAGGSGTFLFTLTGASGGSITSGGAYTAGPSGGTADVVTVTDTLGNSATASVTVGAGVTISLGSTSVPPGGTRVITAAGGSGSFTYALSTSPSGGSITSGGAYTAGPLGSVTDGVIVTDSLGNTATGTITVGAIVSISPSSTTVPQRGTRTFTAAGGSGTGYTYAVSTNSSGGSVTSGGAYTAGATGGVTDIVTVTDSLGRGASATVTVGAGLRISPSSTSVSPRGALTFSATGGSGTGFTFTLSMNRSGGSVTSGGAYTAGGVGSVIDVVTVTDSLGNGATATISVNAGITLTPATVSTTPRGMVHFAATGGSGQGYVYSTTTLSGATIDASGNYVAGIPGSVSDVVTVSDTLGNSATATVTVGAGVSITPSATSVSPRGTRTFSATGGTGTGFTYALSTNASGGHIDSGTGAYTAGATGSVTDEVTASDPLGNTATATITVNAGVNLSPLLPSTPPKGTILFVATGGSGADYVYSVTTNPSGASIDATGKYIAGVTGGGTDVVTVTDSLGNTASTSITVSGAIALVASGTTTPPRGALSFTASGGSGAGFAFSLGTNASGGTIDPVSGAYLAGSADRVTDIVLVTDPLGNVATANVAVGAGVSITPASPATPPRGQVNLVASGGSGLGFVFVLETSASGSTVDAMSGLFTGGAVGSSVDVVRATDSLGNTTTVAISVGNGLTINPSAPSLAPRQSQSFTAVGGDGTGFTFALTTNGSGGTINTTTGAYVAGTVGNTTDVVTVTDRLANAATATVQIGPALVVTPATLSLAPLGAQTFAVSGGSGLGYRFALLASPSGGSIDPATGAYLAGATGGVTDVVQVVDSFGNVRSVSVAVTAALLAVPSTLSTPPLGSATLAVTGGAGGYTFALTTNGSAATLMAATGAYIAGPTGSTSDLVTVSDANGATTTIRISVGVGVSLLPASPTAAPRARLAFTASGGSGLGYRYALASSPSGGSIDAGTGAYRAGPTSSTIDVVEVMDSLGNQATVTVSIGGGLAINPAMASVAPQATITLVASGGSGSGFAYSLTGNLSGASIVAETGVYRAGATPSVSDEVTVTDSLGNTVATTIAVGVGVLIAPVSSRAAPGGTVVLSASGGSGSGYVFALSSNRSGGTVESSTGVYTAGVTTPGVTDTVTVTDSLGNSAAATIDVGAGVTLAAPSTQTPPGGTITLTAAGGSGTYTFAVRTGGSGGGIVSTTGVYTAGPRSRTTDLIGVTDDLGNSATFLITVGDGVSIAPSAPVAAPGGAVAFTALGGSGTGYVFALTTDGSGGTLDSRTGAYVAGDTDETSDVVTVTDSLGNTSSVSIAIGNHVALNPPAPTAPPRGPVQFAPSGGSGTGYVFTFLTNASGATLDAGTGAYLAGTTPDVTDVIQVVDSLGKSATAEVTVGPGLALTPVTATLAPGGAVSFRVSGGSGSGYRFTLPTNGSGATVDGALGDYLAGGVGGTTDTLAVSDSLGNGATAAITVGLALTVGPADSTLPPLGAVRLVAAGGAIPYAFAVTTNRSGASINVSTAEFVAGPTPNVRDVVTVTDANGVSRPVTINVGPGVSITPASPKVAPAGTLQLEAAGGSGAGFTWRLVDSSAGGSVDGATGVYTASRTPAAGAADVIEVRDALGNTARVTIRPKLTAVSASGGSGGCNCDAGGRGDRLPSVLLALLSLLGLLGLATTRRRHSVPR